ncbi:MAG: type II toxin-antitoxin system PemK/MazF family toxin [bacterium]
MKRGDVWQVDLGTEAGKRPALILTRNAVLPYLNKLTVAEITTKSKGYPTEIDINQKANLKKHSFVQVDNIQTISKQRFLKCIGSLDESTMKVVSQKVVLALNLEDAF